MSRIGNLVVSTGTEIDVVHFAFLAAINDGDSDGLALVVDVGPAAAEGVAVGVATGSLGVEEVVSEGRDHLAVAVRGTASTDVLF